MAIKRMSVELADFGRMEFEVGVNGVVWLAVDSNQITIERKDYTQVIPMTAVIIYTIYKKGYTG